MFAAKRIPQILLSGLCLISSSCVSLTSSSDPNQIKTGIPVPHLTLYVRSPYTSPAQLVKIEKVSADGTMVCPYTKRPFYVPGYARKRPTAAQQAAMESRGQTRYLENTTASASASTRSARSQAQATAQAETRETKILHQGRPADYTPPSPPQYAEEAPAPVLPSMLEPKLDDTTAGTVAAAPTNASKKSQLPYGIRVSGQKDFVRSPYAEAHQLVDIAGMPVGSEVKCPYSNKLFRVPPQE